MANTIPLFMVATISFVTRCGLETPTKISAPFNASARVPCSLFLLLMWEISSCPEFKFASPSQMIPLISHMIIFPKPMAMSCLPMATPAAPAPLMTTLSSPIFLPVTFTAFRRAAPTTIAVPCWSSWNTGISQRSFSFFSISKHLGAAMSSRLMPPKLLEIRAMVLTMVSTSLESTHSGNASTPANSLNSAHLPSMTGIPADGPISPRPRTAVPSVITATRLPLRV